MAWDRVERRATGHSNVLPECFEVFKKIEEIHKVIVGNGNPGLKTDVAILQEKENARTKHWFALYVSIAGLAAKALWDFFTK